MTHSIHKFQLHSHMYVRVYYAYLSNVALVSSKGKREKTVVPHLSPTEVSIDRETWKHTQDQIFSGINYLTSQIWLNFDGENVA